MRLRRTSSGTGEQWRRGADRIAAYRLAQVRRVATDAAAVRRWAAPSPGDGVGAVPLLALLAIGLCCEATCRATRERDRALRLVDRQEGVLRFLRHADHRCRARRRGVDSRELLKRSEALIGPELESDARPRHGAVDDLRIDADARQFRRGGLRLSESRVETAAQEDDPGVRRSRRHHAPLAVGWARSRIRRPGLRSKPC